MTPSRDIRCMCDKTDAKADANASLFLLLHVSCIASPFPWCWLYSHELVNKLHTSLVGGSQPSQASVNWNHRHRGSPRYTDETYSNMINMWNNWTHVHRLTLGTLWSGQKHSKNLQFLGCKFWQPGGLCKPNNYIHVQHKPGTINMRTLHVLVAYAPNT